MQEISTKYWQGQEDFENYYKRVFPKKYEFQRNIVKSWYYPFFKNDGKYLDVACGDGYFTNLVYEIDKKRIKSVLGVDLSEKFIQTAKDRYKENIKEGKLDFKVCNVLKKNEIQGKFDCISVMGLFTYIIDQNNNNQNMNNILKSIVQKIKDGGCVLLKDSCLYKGKTYCINSNGYSACYRNYKEYLQVLRKSGLTIIKIHDIPHSPHSDLFSLFSLCRLRNINEVKNFFIKKYNTF